MPKSRIQRSRPRQKGRPSPARVLPPTIAPSSSSLWDDRKKAWLLIGFFGLFCLILLAFPSFRWLFPPFKDHIFPQKYLFIPVGLLIGILWVSRSLRGEGDKGELSG